MTKTAPKRYFYYKCGNADCPTTTVPAGKVERAVVDRIREIARDPGLIEETVAAARNQLAEKRRALKAEARAIAKELRAARGTDRVDALDHRASEIRREIAQLEKQKVDPGALRDALTTFDGIWARCFRRSGGGWLRWSSGGYSTMACSVRKSTSGLLSNYQPCVSMAVR